jgi:hypothetical protein
MNGHVQLSVDLRTALRKQNLWYRDWYILFSSEAMHVLESCRTPRMSRVVFPHVAALAGTLLGLTSAHLQTRVIPFLPC